MGIFMGYVSFREGTCSTFLMQGIIWSYDYYPQWESLFTLVFKRPEYTYIKGVFEHFIPNWNWNREIIHRKVFCQILFWQKNHRSQAFLLVSQKVSHIEGHLGFRHLYLNHVRIWGPIPPPHFLWTHHLLATNINSWGFRIGLHPGKLTWQRKDNHEWRCISY